MGVSTIYLYCMCVTVPNLLLPKSYVVSTLHLWFTYLPASLLYLADIVKNKPLSSVLLLANNNDNNKKQSTAAHRTVYSFSPLKHISPFLFYTWNLVGRLVSSFSTRLRFWRTATRIYILAITGSSLSPFTGLPTFPFFAHASLYIRVSWALVLKFTLLLQKLEKKILKWKIISDSRGESNSNLLLVKALRYISGRVVQKSAHYLFLHYLRWLQTFKHED